MNSKLYCINPNTKEYEEVNTIYGIDIKEILDLIRDYKISKDLKFDKFGKLEEIERLHSIIKEVRKCINDFAIEDEDYSKIYSIEERAILKILDKVGGDKE